MNITPENPSEPTGLKWLKILVAVLTVTLIIGFLTIVGMFVYRFNSIGDSPVLSPLPDEISLPQGTEIDAFTQAEDWYLILTSENELLIYDRQTNELTQKIKIQNN
ncbi:MAG: hypothetical protein F4073_09045 [Rhodobacteraceae bacterium]|nr:hypothetical protein [Paracoccaceae bacterium]MYF45083.1 hypothetical protein [Paracoccaceae bacterium]MYI92084.1 hypothetical protein [Paracoccaceae bacterium]